MKYATYNKYKPSPMAWLDQLPTHWNAAPLRWMSKRYSGGTPDKGNEAYWEDGEIPWINSGAVNDGYITQPSELITREGFANSSAKWIPKDALVMALAGQGKTKGMVAQLGIPTTCNQSMAALIPDYRFAPRYLYYWLTANYQNIRNLAGGEARDGLNLEMLGSIPCPVPPVDEQQSIARFLDAKTAQIDALVAQKRQLIDKLKEKRQALIARTVTRGLPPEAAKAAGLDPAPAMKDSGVEWLGRVPADWVITAVWHQFFLGRGRVISHEDISENPGLYPVYSSQTENDGVLGYLGSFDFDGDYITWTTDGANAGTVFTRSGKFNCTNVCGTLRAKHPNRIDNRYVTYALSIATAEFVRHDINPKLMNNVMKSIRFALPSKIEQAAIADYLDTELRKLESLGMEIVVAVDRLTEYRQALITSAVTGKIDVRELA